MKNKYTFINIISFLFLLILIVISIIKKNTSSIVLVTALSFLWLSGNIVQTIKKKRFTQLVKWYIPLKTAKNYDKIISELEKYKRFYFENVIYTNTLLFKGDEEKYIHIFKKLNRNRIFKGYHYRFLHYTHDYYIILQNGFDNQLLLGENSQFPLNHCINLIIQKDFTAALDACKEIKDFDTEFMNYFIIYIQYFCKKNLSRDTTDELEKMRNLINSNKILKKSFSKLSNNKDNLMK